jgi:hypothetical protein
MAVRREAVLLQASQRDQKSNECVQNGPTERRSPARRESVNGAQRAGSGDRRSDNCGMIFSVHRNDKSGLRCYCCP